MKSIICFFLGVLLTISLTVIAQNNGVMLFKPVASKQVKIQNYLMSPSMNTKIQNEINNGWMVKNFNILGTSSWTAQILVVYEKY